MNMMKTFEAMSQEHKNTVMDMSNAARAALGANGVKPLDDDRAAIFDEACAVYLEECIKARTPQKDADAGK